jgi:hypothetical protein
MRISRISPEREKLSQETEKAFLRQIGDACSRQEREAPLLWRWRRSEYLAPVGGLRLGLGFGCLLDFFLLDFFLTFVFVSHG